MSAKSLEKLLNPSADGDLGEIVRHAQDMGQLVQILRKVLPEADRSALIAANIRDDGELVVLTSTSAWAAKLRFEAGALMTAARESGVEVTSCTVRVSRA